MEPVNHPLLKKLQDLNPSVKDYVAIEPTGTIMPRSYVNWHQRYDQYPVKPDDLWVVTIPKSGTTWTQELVWCLMFGMESEKANVKLGNRFPTFEYDSMIPEDRDVSKMAEDDTRRPGKSWETVQSLSSPRTIKSHLPYSLLPKQMAAVKPKIVAVCRDPRDVCVSYYFFYAKIVGYTISFADFVELFINDLIMHLPYWTHVLEFWRLKQEENILFLRYEDMKEDLASVVKQVATFLGKAVTEEEVKRVVEHCSFDAMKNNPAVNDQSSHTPQTEKDDNLKFMRKGVVGDWRNHLTAEQQKAFKEWTMKNLAGSDFPYYQDYD